MITHKTITRLQIQQKNKERVNIFLDEEYAFSLELMLAAGLRKGQQLTEAEIAQKFARIPEEDDEDDDHNAQLFETYRREHY